MAADAPVRILEDKVLAAHPLEDEEVEAYADYIGIDTELDRDLFWIAKEGLRELPPLPWKACVSHGSDDVFYFNFRTGESQWEHPSDDDFREKVQSALAARRVVAVTLHLELEGCQQVLRGVNMAGNVAFELPIANTAAETLADVRERMLACLALPEGVAARFLTESGQVLGHSHRAEALDSLLAVSL